MNDTNQRIDCRQARPAAPVMLRVRMLVGLAFSFVMGSFVGLLMLIVSVMTLFRCRRFNAEVLTGRMVRICLWCCGVHVNVHRDAPLPRHQCVYISNHTSALDMFVLIALGLPNTRYFLSGFLRKLPPIGLIGYLIGVFWTSPQTQPHKRTQLFQRADATLRRTGESVFLTPEGQQIGKFNKGAFHLATSLEVPIVPIYVHIPNVVDPGPWLASKGFDLRPGAVEVYFMPPIDTSHWTLDQVEQNRDAIKALYARWTQEYRGELPDPYLPAQELAV